MPRSNLSAVERGDREVTLRTLRALALALGVRPGVLADGMLPGWDAAPLGRTALERVARAAAANQPLSDPHEASLARSLSGVVTGPRPSTRSRAKRGADRGYLLLRGRVGPEALASLIERVRARHSRR
jgi:transcriptional regulator with XRE-family HTH domain